MGEFSSCARKPIDQSCPARLVNCVRNHVCMHRGQPHEHTGEGGSETGRTSANRCKHFTAYVLSCSRKLVLVRTQKYTGKDARGWAAHLHDGCVGGFEGLHAPGALVVELAEARPGPPVALQHSRWRISSRTR